MKIAFHSSYLGYRGTEVALMDYAKENREILGNESMFLMPWREGGEQHPVAERMRGIASLRFYRTAEEREGILKEEKADFFYCIKNGFNDGAFSRKVPTGIHAIFRESEFHGDIFAYVSPWLSEVMAYGKAPWVPHMVRFAEEPGNLRAEDEGQRPEGGGRMAEDGDRRTENRGQRPEGRGQKSAVGSQWPEVAIPRGATVFGRHGGDDSFDIPWVQKAVVETAKKNPDIWFLFLNTREFSGAAGLPNIRFLPATADPILKRRFLNTCDAMLHGRMRGETFGLSCLEFAMLGKPVLTYAGSPERAHLEILGEAAVAYRNARELRKLLEDRTRWSVVGGLKSEADRQPSSPARSWKEKLKDYQPEAVMRNFEQVFLK